MGCLTESFARRARDGRPVGRALHAALDWLFGAAGAQRGWTELYLAAPQHGDGVRLVEGYADLVFDTGGGLVPVDYKSDATLPADTLSHYQAQLDGYADLLRRATERPVVRQALLHVPGDTVTVVDLTRRATN